MSRVEEARQELTRLLLEAKPVDRSSKPELWRRRNRSLGLDVSARIVLDAGLAIVVSANVRHDSRPSGSRR